MLDFSRLQRIEIPEGVVTQITDASGMVLWQLAGKVVLEVEKIISNTYAGEITYENEEFILLDIYPKTNGTVSVTYGGLTKTITDTSGAAEPNAQQVYFGTFNGVSDSVATPASGELTIEGDCTAFGNSSFATGKFISAYGSCPICKVISFGATNKIPRYAFGSGMGVCKFNQTSIRIPSNIESIGDCAFYGCRSLQSIYISNGVKSLGIDVFDGHNLSNLTIPQSVESIGTNPIAGFMATDGGVGNNIISVAEDNTHYKIDGNCLIEIATNRLVSGFRDSIIPPYTAEIGRHAFHQVSGLQSLTIPNNVTKLGDFTINACPDLTEIILLSTIPPTLETKNSINQDSVTIIVPKGCSEAYKTAEYWSEYADKIVEAS